MDVYGCCIHRDWPVTTLLPPPTSGFLVTRGRWHPISVLSSRTKLSLPLYADVRHTDDASSSSGQLDSPFHNGYGILTVDVRFFVFFFSFFLKRVLQLLFFEETQIVNVYVLVCTHSANVVTIEGNREACVPRLSNSSWAAFQACTDQSVVQRTCSDNSVPPLIHFV